MNRRTLLAGILASPFLAWFGFNKVKSQEIDNSNELYTITTTPNENIEDGDRGTVLYYDFQYHESCRLKQPLHCRYVETLPSINLSVTYRSKDGLVITWDWICCNPKFDGYPFNIKKFVASPLMDDDGVMHSHSNVKAGNIPHRMYGPNKFILSSIAYTPPGFDD